MQARHERVPEEAEGFWLNSPSRGPRCHDILALPPLPLLRPPLRHAEASTGFFTPPNSAWREIDGRWLCPLCYWWVYYWQGISSTAHSQQGSLDPAMLSAGDGARR